jgi:acetyl esterase/lipase
MPGAGLIHPASLPAKLIYAVANAVTPRLVRRLVLHAGGGTIAGRMTKLGRRVNTVAKLQRVRPFLRVSVTRGDGPDVPVEVVRCVDRALPLDRALRDGAILYFHGGGFITGGLDTHLHVVANLARRTRLPVLHADYRQYPQVTVDGSVDDCIGAYRWLLGQGADPAKTVLAGDSAGGFLAFATALTAQQRGLPAPAGVIGISALLELDGVARTTHTNLSADAFGIPAVLPDIVDLVCPSAKLRHELSPINGRLETMPPVLLIAAESEILRCDAERLHAALQQVGGSSRLELWARQLHAFPALFPFLPDSRAAFELICRFVAERLAEPGRSGEARREVS